jgi:thioredoxin reductase
MTAPSMVALTSAITKTARLELTTSMTDIIAAVATGHAAVLDAIYVSNIGSATVDITIVLKRSSTETDIIKEYRLGARQNVNVILGRTLNLEEGDALRGLASANSSAVAHVPYLDAS